MRELSTYITDFDPLLEEIATQVKFNDIRTCFLNIRRWNASCSKTGLGPADALSIEKHNFQLIQSCLLLYNLVETDFFDVFTTDVDDIFAFQTSVMAYNFTDIFAM